MKGIINFVLVVGLIFLSKPLLASDKNISEYTIGDFTLLSVQDTPMQVESELLIGDKAEITKYVPTGKCDGSINVFLLKNGKDLVLFDTGLGSFGGGKAVSLLSEAGVSPDKITKVVLTHLHGDHIGGSMAGGQKVFPNADIYASEKELAFWSDKKNSHKAPKDLAFLFEIVENFKKIYGNKIKTFKEGAEIMSGVKSSPVYGHTAGMTAYEISSKGDSMFIWGDIIHCLSAQMANPSISISYDSDPIGAAATRNKILKERADKSPVAGAHLPFPGVISIKKNGNNYEYQSIEGK